MNTINTIFLKSAKNNIKVYKDELQFDFAKLLALTIQFEITSKH